MAKEIIRWLATNRTWLIALGSLLVGAIGLWIAYQKGSERQSRSTQIEDQHTEIVASTVTVGSAAESSPILVGSRHTVNIAPATGVPLERYLEIQKDYIRLKTKIEVAQRALREHYPSDHILAIYRAVFGDEASTAGGIIAISEGEQPDVEYERSLAIQSEVRTSGELPPQEDRVQQRIKLYLDKAEEELGPEQYEECLYEAARSIDDDLMAPPALTTAEGLSLAVLWSHIAELRAGHGHRDPVVAYLRAIAEVPVRSGLAGAAFLRVLSDAIGERVGSRKGWGQDSITFACLQTYDAVVIEERALRRELELYEAYVGDCAEEIFDVLMRIADFYDRLGAPVLSDMFLSRAIAIAQELSGQDGKHMNELRKKIESFGGLSIPDWPLDDSLSSDCLERLDKELGSDNILLAARLMNRANRLYAIGWFEESRPYFSAARAIFKKNKQTESRLYLCALMFEAYALRKTGRSEEASKLEAEAKEIAGNSGKAE